MTFFILGILIIGYGLWLKFAQLAERDRLRREQAVQEEAAQAAKRVIWAEQHTREAAERLERQRPLPEIPIIRSMHAGDLQFQPGQDVIALGTAMVADYSRTVVTTATHF